MEIVGNVATGDAVLGSSESGAGVHGINGQGFDPGGSGLGEPSAGICGEADSVEGVFGASTRQHGVHGISGLGAGVTPPGGCGVYGESHQWPNNAVFGSSNAGHGVHGINGAGNGTAPTRGCGVYGESATGYGVYGASSAGTAGVFDGNVLITGALTVQGGGTIGGVSLVQMIEQLQQTILQLQNSMTALATKEQQDVNSLSSSIASLSQG